MCAGWRVLTSTGFVFVSVPPPKGEQYAFSVPLTSIYSVLVYPPSVAHWNGSATIKYVARAGIRD